MPHLWFETTQGDWAIQTLSGESCLKLGNGAEARLEATPGETAAEEIRILPAANGAGPQSWVLLGSRTVPVHINGEPLWLGLRTLRDKDEIRVGSERCFFSTEELAHVVPFQGLAQPAFCPRCKQRIEPGDLSVCCPNCRSWHHQTDKFPCWRYSEFCALCLQQSTALDTDYSFTPETL